VLEICRHAAKLQTLIELLDVEDAKSDAPRKLHQSGVVTGSPFYAHVVVREKP
jgi:hypothetical protein